MPLSRALDEIYVAISHRLSATLDRNIWWNMVAMRYRITHERDINDITLERDWMKVFREYIKSRIEKAQLYVIFSKIYFSCFGKYVIVFRRRAPRSTKFLFRYIIGFIMCTPGPSLSFSSSMYMHQKQSNATDATSCFSCRSYFLNVYICFLLFMERRCLLFPRTLSQTIFAGYAASSE